MRSGVVSVELGIYSFGDVPQDPQTGRPGSTSQAMRNLLEAIQVADQAGLDYFGVGEHHTREMPAAAAATVLAAAASTTREIRLGSSVTVLSTEDPVRVFQQYATLDALSDGRAEVTAGRGSSVESFPLFGHSLADYEELYEEKLDLLLRLNALDEDETITWSGRFRAPLTDAVIVPRPVRGRLPIWRGTGGSTSSSQRAGEQGLPVMYGIIAGRPASYARLAQLYRTSAARAGHTGDDIRIAVASPGFLHPDAARAGDLWWPHWRNRMAVVAPTRGMPVPDRSWFDAQAGVDGALYVGAPEQIAERIVDLHAHLGHSRHILEVDYGHLPHKEFLRAIELLGTEVKPLVDEALSA
jgi:probable LLM family oxidoreductase